MVKIPKEDKETIVEFSLLLESINKEIIEKTGGTLGEVNKGILEFSVWRALVARKKAHGSEKNVAFAATLLKYIAERHPFKDGNKRTAYISAKLMLLQDKQNLLYLKIPYDETIDYIIKVAQKRFTEEQICDWLKNHSIDNSEIDAKTTNEIKKFLDIMTQIATHKENR